MAPSDGSLFVCFRLPEHAGHHAALGTTPPGLRCHATSFPDAPHDVHAACRSVAGVMGTMHPLLPAAPVTRVVIDPPAVVCVPM